MVPLTKRSPPAAEERRSPEATRRSILTAAQELLLEVGRDGFSIRGVSQRCGFSAPTIYHHFRDKNGLVDALLEEVFAEMLARLQAAPRRADPVLYLRELSRAFVDFGLANPEHYALLSTPRLESEEPPPSAEAARNLVFSALEAAAARAGLRVPDLESAFQATWVVLHGLVSLHIVRPGYAWSKDLTELSLDLIERGLLGKEAGAG